MIQDIMYSVSTGCMVLALIFVALMVIFGFPAVGLMLLGDVWKHGDIVEKLIKLGAGSMLVWMFFSILSIVFYFLGRV